jgi:hypothetical protein
VRNVSQEATCRINGEDYSIWGFGALLSGRSLSKFQKHPSSLWYSSTVKMEAVGSSETSVNFYRRTECQIHEDCNINSHYCENLISFILVSASLKFFTFLTCVYKFGPFLLSLDCPNGPSPPHCPGFEVTVRHATFGGIPLHE